MTNRESFRRNLNRLLSLRDYSQRDLANFTNSKYSTVSGWTRGISYPRADTMEKIAQFFGVSIFELVCENESDEEKLLRGFRVLSPLGKEKALERMEELKALYWYDKDCIAK